MTTVLVHELAVGTPPLLERLRRVLSERSDDEARSLLARAVVKQHVKPRMVLVGQFSSGKSTLVKALTDGVVDPKIDADIATDEVTEYPWDGQVVLVDTPGVQSGLREHDELAWEAIGKSDFILFAVTVDLFDDASAEFLRQLANTQQKFDQLIVVITQKSKRQAAAGVREDAVRSALGTVAYLPPICEVDSLYYLRSLEPGDRSSLLRASSRIDELRAAINSISEDRGELAQLRRPIQLIRQLADEAEILFEDDPHRRMALNVLAAQRKAVTDRRYFIEQRFIAAETSFKSSCQTDVVAFVDLATTVDPDADPNAIPETWNRLTESLDRHAERFAREINTLTENQFDTLTKQLGEIDDSNRVAELLRFAGSVSPTKVDAAPASRAAAAGGREADDVLGWVRKVGGWLQDGRQLWGAGDGVKGAAGSFGHQAVLDVGHFFGVKFKPWQAVRVADNIGKAAKVAGYVAQVGIAAAEFVKAERDALQAERAAERRRSAFVTELMAMADHIATDARKQLAGIIDPPMNEVLNHIDDTRDAIVAGDRARTAAAAELQAIVTEADRLLSLGAGPKVIDADVVGA